MKKTISMLLVALSACSAHPEEDYTALPPLYDAYLEESKATSVFLSKTRKDATQIVFARGKTTDKMFMPQTFDTASASLVEAIRIEPRCIVASTDRLQSPMYKAVTKDLGVTYLIMCPVNESMFIGAAFKGVPQLEELALTRKLKERTHESL